MRAPGLKARIRAAMVLAGMNGEALAAVLGLSESTLCGASATPTR